MIVCVKVSGKNDKPPGRYRSQKGDRSNSSHNLQTGKRRRGGFHHQGVGAKAVKRSERFVQQWWNGDPYDSKTERKGGRPHVLSQESKELVKSSLSKPQKGVRTLAFEIAEKRGKVRSSSSVYRELQRQGAKPFHVVAKPLKTELNIRDRLWFCDFLRNWDIDDFRHLAPSDEFFLWTFRKPNHQNDRIWALNITDISEDDKYRPLVKHPDCIGMFLMFTAKRLMWVIKQKGESWDGDYFR
jgi:transposase